VSLPLISCILLPILFPVFDDDVVPCALPFAEGPKLSLSVLSVACVVAVNFEVYTLSNSDTVCDECCVLAYTSDTHL
jgi:hypothetical protein